MVGRRGLAAACPTSKNIPQRPINCHIESCTISPRLRWILFYANTKRFAEAQYGQGRRAAQVSYHSGLRDTNEKQTEPRLPNRIVLIRQNAVDYASATRFRARGMLWQIRQSRRGFCQGMWHLRATSALPESIHQLVSFRPFSCREL